MGERSMKYPYEEFASDHTTYSKPVALTMPLSIEEPIGIPITTAIL